jgi:hypothetical protein
MLTPANRRKRAKSEQRRSCSLSLCHHTVFEGKRHRNTIAERQQFQKRSADSLFRRRRREFRRRSSYQCWSEPIASFAAEVHRTQRSSGRDQNGREPITIAAIVTARPATKSKVIPTFMSLPDTSCNAPTLQMAAQMLARPAKAGMIESNVGDCA